MKLVDNELKKLLAITDETLLAIIDSEFQKPADDMDIDLIEICLDIIISRKEAETGKQEAPKRYNTKKVVRNIIMIVAAISLFLAALSVANADIFIDLGNAVVNMFTYKDDTAANIDTTNSDTTPDGYALTDTDLAKQLATYGIEPATLPEALTNGDYNIINIEQIDANNEPITNLSKTIRADFKKGKIEGSAFITKTDTPDNRDTKQSQFLGIESAELVEVNGLDVFLFKQYKSYYIRYEDSTSQIDYNISLSKCDYKEAKRIAESIK